MGKSGFRLRRSPLIFVLAQVVVNPVENLQKYIGEIQDRLRKMKFIEFEQADVQTATLAPGKIAFTQKRVWNFMTRDRQMAVVASSDMIVVQTRKYDHFEPFCDAVMEVMAHAHEAVEHYSVLRRLGLRYVNRIAQISEGDPIAPELVAPSLLGMKLGATGAFRRVETTCPMKKGLLSVRYSDLPNQPPLPLGIETFGMDVSRPAVVDQRPGLLDIDRYHDDEEDFDLNAIKSDLTAFNEDAETAFLAAVTDRAREYWQEEG